MAKQTRNYNLTMPESTDFADITPISENMNIIDEVLAKKADLDENQTVFIKQIPPLDYIPKAEKGAPKGVATLGTDGLIPKEQIPQTSLTPQLLIRNALNATAVAATNGEETVTSSDTGAVKKLKLPDYGRWAVTAQGLTGDAVPATVTVDTVKQYTIELEWFEAYLDITCPAHATVLATCGDHQYSAESGEKGKVFITVSYIGDYQISYYTDSIGSRPIDVSVNTNGETYVVDLS